MKSNQSDDRDGGDNESATLSDRAIEPNPVTAVPTDYDAVLEELAVGKRDARQALALLRLSEITLGRWRLDGSGPPYRKFGRRVVYARADLFEWANAQQRRSTSEEHR